MVSVVSEVVSATHTYPSPVGRNQKVPVPVQVLDGLRRAEESDCRGRKTSWVILVESLVPFEVWTAQRRCILGSTAKHWQVRAFCELPNLKIRHLPP